MRSPVGCVILLILTVLFGDGLSKNCRAGETWPRFRGPNGSGISDESGIPTNWSNEDLLWKVELPGVGHGSPVIWGNKLFVNCALDEGQKRIVQCRFLTSGELLWERDFPSITHETHKFNSFATGTPAVDAKHVYVAWGTPEDLSLVALTHSGELVWESHGLGTVEGETGFGTSPVVYGNLVVIANDTDGESALLALDCETGKLAWKTPRPGGRLNYATPCLFPNPQFEDQLICVAWPIGVTAVNLKDGSIAWETACFETGKGQRAISSPIIYGNLILATSAFTNNPKHLVVLKTEAGVVEEHFRVDNSTVPHIPSLLAQEGLLYAWADKGICTCYDIATGNKLWQERIGGNYFSSPVCVNGVIYCPDADGICVVIRAGREYEELARIDLGDATRATPAIANNTMVFRTFSHLIAIGAKSEQK